MSSLDRRNSEIKSLNKMPGETSRTNWLDLGVREEEEVV